MVNIKLVLISGTSGAGKGTLISAFRKSSHGKKFIWVPSVTDREPRRDGEKAAISYDCFNYHFVTPARFDEMIRDKMFAEWTRITGHRKGKLVQDIENVIDGEIPGMMELDVNGHRNLRRLYGDRIISIFLGVPNPDIIRERLEQRGTETPTEIAQRLEIAEEEMKAGLTEYDYLIYTSELPFDHPENHVFSEFLLILRDNHLI